MQIAIEWLYILENWAFLWKKNQNKVLLYNLSEMGLLIFL